MTTPVIAELQEVFREVFDDPNLQVTPATTAADIPSWDSLTHVVLILTMEKRFGIRFRSFEVERLQSVGELVDLISAGRPPQP